MSDSLRPHGLQHSRLSCPSLSSGVCSYSCPLNQWCHPTISFSVTPFSSCPQSFIASGSFPVVNSSHQIIRASASASVSLMHIQGWFPLGLAGLISLLFKELSRFLSSTTFQKHQSFGAQPTFSPTLKSIHDYRKSHNFDCGHLSTKWCLYFLICCLGFVIAFLNKEQADLTSWLQSLSVVILVPKKINFATVSIFYPISLPWSCGTVDHALFF